jgi:uncharacterized protein (TIGR03085 family)
VIPLAKTERVALCDLFDEVGPDAPTLCGTWTTRDLAAHLVVRESRPDAAVGIVVAPLAGWMARVQAGASHGDWLALVGKVRNGPPRWSPARLGSLEEAFNGVEFFVHHEDVRRAAPGWQPRELPEATQRALWHVVQQRAKLHFRASRVGVILATPDGDECVASRRPTPVTVTGPPGELVLYMNGRTEHARVVISGDAKAIRTFETTDLSV